MGGPRLTQEQKNMALRLRRQGMMLTEIARQLNCHRELVRVMTNGRLRQGVVDTWTPRSGRLGVQEREQILLELARGDSMSAIARSLGRSASTVTREVKVNGGVEHYGAWRAHVRARHETRRPKAFKLERGRLAREVTRQLEALWSPREIAQRLRLDYPDNPETHVSHETIYQSLFVQGRIELRRELTRCLRSGRTKRRSQGRLELRGKIPNMVMLSERPAEADDRAVPGHWEGDLIIGKNGLSAVGTLVERSTRLVLLLHLPNDHSAKSVEMAMRKAIKTLPNELKRSVTWDQGKEMSTHANFTVKTGVPVYFCDPHSPWQRGSNENTNGLLRQYMPKGTDLSQHSSSDLRRFQRSLNGRPRETLGFLTPLEKFAEFVALTP